MAPMFANGNAWKARVCPSSDHTDKMKVLPVLALASAHAYTVFEIGATCDLEADSPVPCGVNEMCGEDKKVS